MRTNFILFLLGCLSLMSSCNIINPDEGVPSFLYIEQIDFESGITDGNSHKITEIWIYQGGTMLGAYDLPAKVPVLEEGMTAFSIRAGIKNNGISSNRIVYPFYTRFETTVDLVPGEVDTLVPYFTLKDGIAIPDEVFAMFDDPGSNYAETSSSLAEMITSTIPEDVYGGTGGSGYIHLDSEESVWEAKSLGEVDLPRGEFVFLEFDYRCNNTLAVGLYANTGPSVTKEPALFLYPTTNSAGQSTWNKVYVDLGGPISNNPSAEDFNVYFESSLGTSLDEAEVWLDNIKIIHYD